MRAPESPLREKGLDSRLWERNGLFHRSLGLLVVEVMTDKRGDGVGMADGQACGVATFKYHHARLTILGERGRIAHLLD